MPYSFPVFRRGIIFKTEQLVSVKEARAIAKQIKKSFKSYDLAFKEAVKHGNHASGFKTDRRQRVKQYIAESHILNFPSITFKLEEFTIESRNSVTVCMHEHQSKIWTRLTCAEVNGVPASSLTADDVRRFFRLAAKKAKPILAALTDAYIEDVKEAGVAAPKPGRYSFQFRAYNSTRKSSDVLCNRLSEGLRLTEALNGENHRSELLDYFSIVFGKRVSSLEIERALNSRDLEVFGYWSPNHEGLFAANITEQETDICGYGHDGGRSLRADTLSHSVTKDLLKEYAQQF